MDFYGILFDMKNGKKVPYSKTYFDTLFAAKLAEMQIKTLTGTLPLNFRTSETALRFWIIYGNNYEHKYSTSGTLPLTFTTQTAGAASDWSISGNDKVGKNLLEITAETQTRSGVTFTVDKQAGTVTLNGDTSSGFSFAVAERTDLDGTYLLSGCADGGSSASYDLYMYDAAEQRFSERCYDSDDVVTFNCVAGHTTRIYIQCRKNYIYDNVVFKPMLRLPDTSADFEPYQVGVGQRTANIFTNVGSQNGYLTDTGEIVTPHANLRYTDFLTIPTGATTITFDANFSNSPMNAPAICFYDASKNFISGEIYAQSTPNPRTFTVPNGAFYCRTSYRTAYSNVMLVEGSTAPQTFIPYGYQVPLTVSQTGQTDKNYDIYIGDAPLTAGQSISKTSTGIDIAAIAGSNTITTELYNKPEMSIEGVDYVGVGQRTKNLFDVDDFFAKAYVKSNVTFTKSGNDLKITATDTNDPYVNGSVTNGNNLSIQFRNGLMSVQAGDTLTFSYTTSAPIYHFISFVDSNYDGVADFIKSNESTNTFTIPQNCKYILIRFANSQMTANQEYTISDIMLVEGSTAPQTYIPYGYEIPLTVTCDRNLLNIYGNMAYSGGVHLIDYNVDTSSVTGEMSANSFFQLGVQNAIIKGDETFVISFDKTTAGTAEMRMMNGTGSSAEIIETFDISAAKSYRVVFECKESFGNVYPWLVATEAATNTFEHIMIKKASDKGGFVPYGAKYEYNVPIDAPLTEGQSVSDTQTISTFEGTNTLDTTLTNKPNMSITYKGG